MKMKRESNDGDGPQDQKRNRRNEETVRILIPSSVSRGLEYSYMVYSTCSLLNHICRLRALSLAKEANTYKRCALRYYKTKLISHKPKLIYMKEKTTTNNTFEASSIIY